MKRLQKWHGTAIIVLVVAIATVLASCHDRRLNAPTQHSMSEYVDSTDLVKVLNQCDNPEFTSLDDVCNYYQNEKQWRIQDSVFFSLPPETITNIYTVLVKRGIPPTKMSIAAEYLDNVKVYSNLPRQDVVQYKALEKDIPNTEVVDTIINGEHMQILQTSKTEVK